MKLLSICFFILIFIGIASAQQINPDEYLNEFNNVGETCNVVDAFFYTNSINKLSFTSVYECCEETRCIRIPFDVQNKKEFSSEDLQESFNINFARDNIRKGVLKPSNYFPESFDVCSYFSDKLPEQSRNLAVKAADSIEDFAPKNAQKIYKTMKGVGFATGVISEFDIGIFIVSVGCNKLSKQENEAFFKVGECYNNVQSIESGATHYGITSQTYTCMKEADFLLDQILQSWAQKIKGALNKVASGVKAVWDWGKEVSQGNISAKFDITETSYEAAGRIKAKLNIEKEYLTNPNSLVLSGETQIRLSEKKRTSETLYYNLKQEYDLLDEKVPGGFSEFITNIFYKPNVDYSKTRLYLNDAKSNISLMKELVKVSKYNSALKLNDSISFSLNSTLESYKPLSEIEQKIDWIATLFWIAVIVLICYMLYKFKLKNNNPFQ